MTLPVKRQPMQRCEFMIEPDVLKRVAYTARIEGRSVSSQIRFLVHCALLEWVEEDAISARLDTAVGGVLP